MIAALALGFALVTGGLSDQVHELTLPNGMRWLVVERHDAPVFTGFVRLRVGGADEAPGQTGLAHLFEHMAFKGTPVLGTRDWAAEAPLLEAIAKVGDALAALERKGQADSDEGRALKLELERLSKAHKALTDENALARLYQSAGAVGLNATTDKDLTSYYVSLPKNRLALWMTVEAQRLAAPVLRDFYTERAVVQEERLRRIETDPGGAMYEELMQLAFVTSPYRWPTVGYAGDLKALSMAEARAFFDAHYVASNAVGCVVGDVTVAEVRALLDKTFRLLPARPLPAAPVFSEPPSRAQRRSALTFDAKPRLLFGFRKPPPPSRDDAIFDVFDVLLGEGNTGRLQQRLVFKDRLAQSVGTFSGPGSRFDGLFIVSVVPLEGVAPEAVERALWDELERLGREGPDAKELDKVRNRVTADLARTLETNAGIAGALSRYEALLGDWRYVEALPKTIETITADEVKAAAAKYFVRENNVIVSLSPIGAAGRGEGKK
ncbi:MAG: pitrilysin family protein [Myxococcota bacterium]|jgi:predicted Zn-dependent peptidase